MSPGEICTACGMSHRGWEGTQNRAWALGGGGGHRKTPKGCREQRSVGWGHPKSFSPVATPSIPLPAGTHPSVKRASQRRAPPAPRTPKPPRGSREGSALHPGPVCSPQPVPGARCGARGGGGGRGRGGGGAGSSLRTNPAAPSRACGEAALLKRGREQRGRQPRRGGGRWMGEKN